MSKRSFIQLLALALFASSAAAQAGEYERSVAAGVDAFNAAHYEEARLDFERAHGISPNARTHRALGQTYFELHDYTLALWHIESSLTDTRRSLEQAQRVEMRELQHRAEQRVALVDLRVTPANARIEIDDAAPKTVGQRTWLTPGSHRLRVSAPSHVSAQRTIEAVADSKQELAITLEPERAPTAAVTSTSPAIAPWIVIGAGGVMLATTIVTGIVATSAENRLERACPNKECAQPSALADVDTAKTYATVTNVLLVSGLVTTGVGAVWLGFFSGDKPPVTAACTMQGCAATARIRF